MRRSPWLFPFLLTGCTTLVPLGNREASLFVYPKFSSKTSALVECNSLSSIATLDIVPYLEVSSGSYSPISSLTGNPVSYGVADMLKLSQASPSIDPNRPFLIRRLKANSNYRIWARAYNAANALISNDANSYVDVLVGSDDAPAMASLPVNLLDVSFGAKLSVDLNTEGRFDFLKATLYSLPANLPIMTAQTARLHTTLAFDHLQGNTNYRLLVEAHKFGGVAASNSLDLAIKNDTEPATASLTVTVPYVATTFAGRGATGYSDAVGTAAAFNYPYGIMVDPSGNLYVTDEYNYLIRKVTPGGAVSTLAGNQTASFADANGLSASFNHPTGIARDQSGNIFIVDVLNARIRKMAPNGDVATFAGNGSTSYANGIGTAATFNLPTGIAIDAFGNLFITEFKGNRVRKITPGAVVTTVAGSGETGFVNGNGAAAVFSNLQGIAIDASGDLYVADFGNHCIRKVTQAGVVTTFAGNGSYGTADGTGTSATFHSPQGLAFDPQGNLIVSDSANNRIRRITPAGVVTTIAGNGGTAIVNGTGVNAQFNIPTGVAFDAYGNLYVMDDYHHLIRKLQ